MVTEHAGGLTGRKLIGRRGKRERKVEEGNR